MAKREPDQQVRKHLKEILLLFSVPIGIIVILFALLYIPRLFANPGYDFIYCEGYYCNERFSVGSSGHLQVAPEEDNRSYYRSDANLYYYDVRRDATRPLQTDEATRYRLDATSKSPDGYTLKHTSGGGILFLGNYQSSWSLSKGLISKPATLGPGHDDNKFIGWVVK